MNKDDIYQLFHDGSTVPMDGTPVIMLIEGNGCVWAGKFVEDQWLISMAVVTPTEGTCYAPKMPGFTRPSDFRPDFWRPEGHVRPFPKEEKS